MESKYTLPVITLLGGGAVVYYLLSMRDTTPVGLVTTKKYGAGSVPVDGEDNAYQYEIVDGTYRASEDSLPLKSSDSKALLIIYEGGEIVDADLITVADYVEDAADDADTAIEKMKRWKTVAGRYGETTALQTAIDNAEGTQTSSAEMVFRPSATLQSHFIW